MNDNLWRIEDNQASLTCNQLTARIDLSRADLGLTDLIFAGDSYPGTLLGVVVESGVSGRTTDDKHNDGPIEAYVRGNDLVVTYPPTVDRPVGFQVEWEAQHEANGTVILDAMVSVQTPLLETYPTVEVRSSLAAEGYEYVDGETGAVTCGSRDESSECMKLHGIVLARLAEKTTYAEMVHPTDFLDWSIQPSAKGHASKTKWRMCNDFMEKGVIRRLRARGVFLPSGTNAQTAMEALQSLIAEQPPLTA